MDISEHQYKLIYDNDWYTQKIVESIDSYDDLIINWFNHKIDSKTVIEKRNNKIGHCYDNVELTGHGLELAFGLGTSMHWILNRYDVILDGVDFNEALEKIINIFKARYEDKVYDMWIGDMQIIPKSNDYYDFINSCSVWEHLPNEVYWNVLKECYRVLKPNGLMGVYVDQGSNEQHIRSAPPYKTRQEMEKVGFIAKSDYLYTK